jgi:hypothetical protein
MKDDLKKLHEELKGSILSEAAAIMKQVGRAEAKAQATIRMNDTVAKLEAMLARERADSARKFAVLAENMNKLLVIVSVMQDIIAETTPLGATPEKRRARFGELCTIKNAQFEVVGGKA